MANKEGENCIDPERISGTEFEAFLRRSLIAAIKEASEPLQFGEWYLEGMSLEQLWRLNKELDKVRYCLRPHIIKGDGESLE